MLYRPDLMIYLWMLPVFGLVLLPLLWSVWCVMYRSVERSKLAEVRGFVEVGGPGSEKAGEVERRRISRVRLEDGRACVAEEMSCCRAYVANVSAEGICLNNLPRKMFKETDPFRVVLKTRQQDYSMYVRPRWKKTGANTHSIGGEILKVPSGWKEFVDSLGGEHLAAAA